METAFYNNRAILDRSDSIRKLKSSLTLDLSTREAPLAFDGILSSPDVRMLKLATPELDRLLFQHQMVNGGRGGGALTGPPPPPQIWLPKTVTEEQEAYARGFVDALLELHNKREDAVAANSDYSCVAAKDKKTEVGASYDASLDLSRTGVISNVGVPYSFEYDGGCKASRLLPEVSFLPSAPVYDSVVSERQIVNLDSSRCVSQTLPALDKKIKKFGEAVCLNSGINLTAPTKHQQLSRLKGAQYTEASQWQHPTASAPLIGFLSDAPSISPIDMVQQEAIKLARKRSRNRLAATRCRNRKLERIARLQGRVDELKEQNVQLTTTATELRELIIRMRHEIDNHVLNGCCLNDASQSYKFV